MTISRKTPAAEADEHDERQTGPRPIAEATEPPISDAGVSASWPSVSDVVPARSRSGAAPRRSTEPPTLAVLGPEELLRLATELPIDEGAEAVARAVAEVVRDVAGAVAVGVVLAARVVLVLAPAAAGTEVQHAQHDDVPPRRMFPPLRDEWIVPLRGVQARLHVGDATSVHRDLLRTRSLADLSERAALVLSTGLRGASRLQRSRVDGGQLRALQARVIQTEKLASVGQIAAKVVHELNNPLTAIVTYAGFLTKKLERAGHEPADVERLRRIGESADRILRFSRELTTYARPNEETAGLVAVHEVIERAVVFCEHVTAEHGIRVVTDLDPHLPAIVGRRGQLTQVFVNLVTNACHAIQDASRGEDGVIEILGSRTDDGGVRISVGDNGKGISPENVVRIFDPFFTTKQEGRGTGLGLSIVRSIVEAHGGRVWVRSVVGSGSSFVVELRGRTLPTTPPARG